MSRKNFSEEERDYVFKRDKGRCKGCRHELNFYNRHYGEVGAWQMGHKKADADGGSSHLRNIVALCLKCNKKQGTKSFAGFEPGFEYDNFTDKAKDFLNRYFLTDVKYDMTSARRSISEDAELQDFKEKVKNNSFEWANKKFFELRPFGLRYQNTKDSRFKKYQLMCLIILEIYPPKR